MGILTNPSLISVKGSLTYNTSRQETFVPAIDNLEAVSQFFALIALGDSNLGASY